MKMTIIERTDVEAIAKIESLGTWEEERYIADKHNSFDVWSWNGRFYKIYKDSHRI